VRWSLTIPPVDAVIVIGNQYPATDEYAISDVDANCRSDVNEVTDPYVVADDYAGVVEKASMLDDCFKPKTLPGAEISTNRDMAQAKDFRRPA